MQYTFITIKLIFNVFILISIYNFFIKYKMINNDYVKQNNFLSKINKIGSFISLGKDSLFLFPKILAIVFIKNFLLVSLIKKSIYMNIYLLAWSSYDLFHFITYILIFMSIFIIASSEMNYFNNVKKFTIISLVLHFINKLNNRFLRIFIKILLVVVFFNIIFIIISFIPHINY